MATAPVNERSMRQHTHKPNGSAGKDAERCPWCLSPISRLEFERIQKRIADQEHARIAKIEADLKARVAREVAKAQTEATAAIAKAKKDAVEAAERRVKDLKASQEKVVTQRLAA